LKRYEIGDNLSQTLGYIRLQNAAVVLNYEIDCSFVYDFGKKVCEIGHLEQLFFGNRRNSSLHFVKALLKMQIACSETTTTVVLKRRNDSSSIMI